MNRSLLLMFTLLLTSLSGIWAQTLEQKLNVLKDSLDFRFEPLPVKGGESEKYLLRLEQPVGHHSNDSNTFDQRIIITHYDFSRPVVMITEGYAANYALEKGYTNELTELLEANQVCIEHRYFGESVPDTLDWDYLSTEESAADHHHVMELIRALYPTKVISTGISKGGQTTLLYNYYYPNDADLSVAYVAPVAFSVDDPRVDVFLKHVGEPDCRERILAFQRKMLKNKELYLHAFGEAARKKGLTYSMGNEKAYELIVFEYAFAFWQWGMVECKDIPLDEDQPEKLIRHLDKVASLDWVSEQGISELQPYFYQAMHEIGLYGYNLEYFQGLTSYSSKPIFDFSYPKGTTVKFMPETMEKMDFFLRHRGKNIIFIYGEYDPWSATAADLSGQTNALKIVKKGGSHRTRINNLPDNQRLQVLDSLKAWLGQPAREWNPITTTDKKVTGVGGIFFKSTKPSELRQWYHDNLGLVVNDYGSLFEFRDSDEPERKAYLQWSPFNNKTTYFQPSEKDFMINYRVHNLEALAKQLKANGVTILDTIEVYEYGKFLHIMDPDGNKIELWEPVDSVFTDLYDGQTTH